MGHLLPLPTGIPMRLIVVVCGRTAHSLRQLLNLNIDGKKFHVLIRSAQSANYKRKSREHIQIKYQLRNEFSCKIKTNHVYITHILFNRNII